MTDEIIKLYENAGIEPIHYDACALEDKYWNNEELANQYGTFDSYLSFECPHHGEGCYSTCEYAYDKDEYPPFTAEKQIKLFKWLIQKYKTISIEHKLNLFYINIIDIYTGMVHIEFDETIAGLINNLWQSLTEEEKQQIKEILK